MDRKNDTVTWEKYLLGKARYIRPNNSFIRSLTNWIENKGNLTHKQYEALLKFVEKNGEDIDLLEKEFTKYKTLSLGPKSLPNEFSGDCSFWDCIDAFREPIDINGDSPSEEEMKELEGANNKLAKVMIDYAALEEKIKIQNERIDEAIRREKDLEFTQSYEYTLSQSKRFENIRILHVMNMKISGPSPDNLQAEIEGNIWEVNLKELLKFNSSHPAYVDVKEFQALIKDYENLKKFYREKTTNPTPVKKSKLRSMSSLVTGAGLATAANYLLGWL